MDDQKLYFLNPPDLASPNGFSHIAVNQRDKVVFISGQVAYNKLAETVGKNCLATQTDQALQNIRTALNFIGLGFTNVIEFTFYVVNLNTEAATLIRDVRRKHLSPEHLPASTMVGVASLAKSDLLIEIKAQAVIP